MKLNLIEPQDLEMDLYAAYVELLMDRKPELDSQLAMELARKFAELTEICEQGNGDAERLKEEIRTCIQCARDADQVRSQSSRPALKFVWRSDK